MSIILAAAMTFSLAACGGKNNTDPQQPETQAPVQTEITTETPAEPETDTEQQPTSKYTVTGENDNKELTMNRQPEASYWFPAQLLEWNADEDEDFIFNVSTVPLAERADLEVLEPVNATQNKDTKVMSISIMNASTSGNAPHGLNKAEANAFTYWQYVDTLVYWGGSSGEGIIVAPSPDVVDAGHKNGVKVIGTVFMPQAAHGGKIEWLDDLLQKREDGTYPVVDKLIEVAQLYGFDGWFINQETAEEEALSEYLDKFDVEGGGQSTGASGGKVLTEDHAVRMQEFLSYFKQQAPDMELIYYDSMTIDGKMDWQNALTEKNAPYMKDAEGNSVADSMFLNFWWTTDSLAPEELLKTSAELAEEKQIDPYDLYAGVDIQSNGYDTPIKWNLFEKPDGGTYTSLGLYCPSWTYFSTDMIQEFWKRENKLWVNAKGDPSADVEAEGDKKVQDAWTTVTYQTTDLAGKTVRNISYRLTPGADSGSLQFRFGNITMMEAGSEKTAAVSNLKVIDTEFDEDGMYAGVRLSWDSDVLSDYYEVYFINQDNTKSLLGVSNTNNFYVNTLPREGEAKQSAFEVVPVNALFAEGTSATTTMEWPDNSIPKAAFTADLTLASPGETITFQSLCSQNTEKVTWTLTGADKESAEGDSVSVTYAEEGVYPVSVKAENASGSSESAKEGYIVITQKAADGLVLLSQDAGTEADAYVNENEAPQFAVDGDVTKKWCATGSAPHEITLDLGAVKAVSAVDVYHAEAGGEGADMNTKSYAIYTSEDGISFEEMRSVTRNTLGTTHDAFTPVNAQFVKLVINKPTQGSDSAARIYEVEVYGLEDTLD